MGTARGAVSPPKQRLFFVSETLKTAFPCGFQEAVKANLATFCKSLELTPAQGAHSSAHHPLKTPLLIHISTARVKRGVLAERATFAYREYNKDGGDLGKAAEAATDAIELGHTDATGIVSTRGSIYYQWGKELAVDETAILLTLSLHRY